MKNRWIYALIGFIAMLFCGLVYSWSILKIPIVMEFTYFSNTQISSIFTLTMCMFCVGALLAGILSKKYKLKYLLWVSGILFCIGLYLCSQSQNIMFLYLGFSILSGFSSGFSYNLIMSCVSQWFLDKKGFISGLLLMGFGLSSFWIGKVYQSFTPPYIGGWRISFQIMGMILLVVLFVSGIVLRYPVLNLKKNHTVNVSDYQAKEMIKTVSFWAYFVWATLLTSIGLILLSQASGLLLEVNHSIQSGVMSTIVGLISIFNGVGRIIFGILFDKLGYKKTMILDLLLFVVFSCIMLISLLLKNTILMILSFVLGGFSYGGITPLNSAVIREFYGNTYFSVNFAMINLNLLLSSFGSTIAGLLFDMSQSYFSTLFLMVGMIAISFILIIFVKKPDKRNTPYF